jgi:MoaA/NifB/PqqE/SkfB family radical SAM enzyme
VPVHVVWEITLACNLKCGHCGSRAGKRRADELSTAECLDVVRQLAAAGTREITLIGGEAYLRRDWLEIAAEIARLGIHCGVQTGARGLTKERIAAAHAAGCGRWASRSMASAISMIPSGACPAATLRRSAPSAT